MITNLEEYLDKVNDKNSNKSDCKDDIAIVNDINNLVTRIGSKIIEHKNIEHAGTYVLDRNLYLCSEFDGTPFDEEILGKNRIISVNPGASNIGREQRYIHYYIVLAEHKNMFIGVPITNMAYDIKSHKHYLRNPFEVELKNPSEDFKKKPFTEYWTTKPSVVDIRNISGLDKRRIIRNNLYNSSKFAPDEYKVAIKNKMDEIFNFNL